MGNWKNKEILLWEMQTEDTVHCKELPAAPVKGQLREPGTGMMHNRRFGALTHEMHLQFSVLKTCSGSI